MKKILVLLVFICAPAFAQYTIDLKEQDNFLKTLKLSDKQVQKIDEINHKYSAKITLLNAQILLNNMQIAQLRPNKNAGGTVKRINYESQALEEELADIANQKDEEIMSTLGFFQRRKYKRHIANRY